MTDDSLERIEKRLAALEQKVERLELGKIQTTYVKERAETSRVSSGSKHLPLKGIVFVLLGGYFLLSSLPSILFRSSYSYGFGFFEFFPALIGGFLLILGLRFFKSPQK